MDVTFEQLRTFVAVIDHGTFEAAATSLNVTPSAISQRIRALETITGRVLLVRSKPAVATEAGEALLVSARRMEQVHDDLAAQLDASSAASRVPLVVNGDSLATWVLPALAAVSSRSNITFEVFRADEQHSLDLLRDGSAMGAVTGEKDPVRGCLVTPLGRMRYRALATPDFIRRRLADGATADALSIAPVVMFDRKDSLQDRFLRRISRRPLDPPRHFVPSSVEFVEAVRLGLGWGMVPDLQGEGLLDERGAGGDRRAIDDRCAALLATLEPALPRPRCTHGRRGGGRRSRAPLRTAL